MMLTCGFPLFYLQVRVGKNNQDFKVFKFRTMHLDADKKGLLTVGGRDPRVTSIGYYLRKYKLDELPQLFNVLIGDMSLVGPRPEVRKYVDLYSEEQKQGTGTSLGLICWHSYDDFFASNLSGTLTRFNLLKLLSFDQQSLQNAIF